MRIFLFVAVALIPLVAGRDTGVARQSSPYQDLSSCPEDYGLQTYAHPKNCDQFYKCANGTLTLETCENGLLFDGAGSVHNFCNYHWATNCGDRLFDPDPARNPESVCEYSFGLFKPTAADCDIFYYRCAYGEAEEVACDKGLAYDDRSHSCNWPDLLLDIGCDPEKVVGFRCPDVSSLPPNSLVRQFLPFPRYAVPNDCGRLVTCVNDYPRLISCGYGSAFNEDTLTCDDAENVPQCANYYKE
ncbi:hypothetical protein DAPPUDRAFT_333110 [Daphnia pulex]|uniref:Chitin-binding type-2 domain-containing protein n=1 Tax=Daphnia pulex TaxID=6669 RepID=E9HRW3_DAPPU|nr:hypothetical protein DAPPUDRAFT_333110 [Daphnia pulex]|eukprot:EFX65517.1 hypothetical protein DAPPUDRAFT_333110 [Daphnia pulex]